jgi:hypothetical protein
MFYVRATSFGEYNNKIISSYIIRITFASSYEGINISNMVMKIGWESYSGYNIWYVEFILGFFFISGNK